MTESSPARAAAMGGVAAAGEAELGRLLPRPEGSTARLDEAMRYACLGGGKRFRPFLTVACGDLFGVPRPRSLRAGAAIEMLHGYSLVHDDLPCMDDDTPRRGQPTVPRHFAAANAVLPGDGLPAGTFAGRGTG